MIEPTSSLLGPKDLLSPYMLVLVPAGVRYDGTVPAAAATAAGGVPYWGLLVGGTVLVLYSLTVRVL